MNNEDNKKNKTITILNCFTSLCFYIFAIINFVKGNISTGVIFLCFGSAYLNKDKENKDNK